MDVLLQHHLGTLGRRSNLFHSAAHAHRTADRHRTGEAQFVGPVIENIVVARNLIGRCADHPGHHHQGQEPMGNRCAKRTVGFRFLRICVNPVGVAGQLGKLVDHILCDFQRLTPGTESVRYQPLQGLDVVVCILLHILLSCFLGSG